MESEHRVANLFVFKCKKFVIVQPPSVNNDCFLIHPPGQSSAPLISGQDPTHLSVDPEQITTTPASVQTKPSKTMKFSTLVKSVRTMKKHTKFVKCYQIPNHPARISPTPETNGIKTAKFPHHQQDTSPTSLQTQDHAYHDTDPFNESSFQPDTDATRSHGQSFP